MILLCLIYSVFSLSIEIFNGAEGKYLTKLMIGGQSLVFQLAFDTDLLMVLDSQSQSKKKSYSSDDSKNFQIISASSDLCKSLVQVSSTSECSFSYVSEMNYTCEGALSVDDVLFGTVGLKEFTFGRILKENPEMGASGIIGLGPLNLDALYGESLLEKVISEEGLRSVIGLCLKEGMGYMHVGGFDSNYSPADFAVYPMTYNNRFSLLLTEVLIENKRAGNNIEAHINTAIPYIYLPYDIILNLIKTMKVFYADACQQALCDEEGHLFFGNSIIRPPSSFPEFTFDLQGLKVILSGFLQKCNINQYCSVIRAGSKYAVIGSPILEKLYLVLDMDNSQFAMTAVKRCEESETLLIINSWEQGAVATASKMFMMASALIMIIVIGWRCGKSYELEFEIISGDDY